MSRTGWSFSADEVTKTLGGPRVNQTGKKRVGARWVKEKIQGDFPKYGKKGDDECSPKMRLLRGSTSAPGRCDA